MTAAFTFPGQGSQAVGMGKALADAFPAARAVFDEVDAALGEKLTAIIWDGPAETLQLTENAQPALMAVSLAALRVLEAEAGLSVGRDAAFVAGHSLGEYSALAAAGSLTHQRYRAAAAHSRPRDAEGGAGRRRRHGGACSGSISRPRSRSPPRRRRARSARPPMTMAAARSWSPATRRRSSARVEIAKGKGAKRAMLLPVSAPFHCALMQPAADAMAEALAGVTIKRAGRRRWSPMCWPRRSPTRTRSAAGWSSR